MCTRYLASLNLDYQPPDAKSPQWQVDFASALCSLRVVATPLGNAKYAAEQAGTDGVVAVSVAQTAVDTSIFAV